MLSSAKVINLLTAHFPHAIETNDPWEKLTPLYRRAAVLSVITNIFTTYNVTLILDCFTGETSVFTIEYAK